MKINIPTGNFNELLLINLKNTLSDHQIVILDAYKHAVGMFYISFDQLCTTLESLDDSGFYSPEEISLFTPHVLHGAWSTLESGYRCLRIMEKPPGFKYLKPDLPENFVELLKTSYSMRNDSQHIDVDVVQAKIFPPWGSVTWAKVQSDASEEQILRVFCLIAGSSKWKYSPPIKRDFDFIETLGVTKIFNPTLWSRPNENGLLQPKVDLQELYNTIVRITDELTIKLTNLLSDDMHRESQITGRDMLISSESHFPFRKGDVSRYIRVKLDNA